MHSAPFDNPEQDADYFRAVLLRMIEDGAAMVATLAKPTDPTPIAERADAYDKVTRSVRRSIMLAERLAHQAAEPVRRLTASRKRLIRDVENAIDRAPLEPEAAADLHEELAERLESPDTDEDLRLRPVPELAAEFRRDFGLDNLGGISRWPRRRPEDVQNLAARAAAHPPKPAKPGAGASLVDYYANRYHDD